MNDHRLKLTDELEIASISKQRAYNIILTENFYIKIGVWRLRWPKTVKRHGTGWIFDSQQIKRFDTLVEIRIQHWTSEIKK